MELHFTFYEQNGRRFCRLEETGETKSVRAKVGPPMLVARLFSCIGAFRPEDYARLQKAASQREDQTVVVQVLDPTRLPPKWRPPEGKFGGPPTT